MKNRKGFRTFTALLLAVMMILGNALAGTYYIEDGSIEVHASETSQTVTQAEKTKEDDGPVISNRDPETSSANTVTIKADDGCTANVKVEDLNIDVSTKRFTPAVKTEGGGNVNIELDGNSSIKSGKYAAGLQKENTGTLTINDADQNGKLEAVGGDCGAGIGGGNNGEGKDITISGGEVTATGGEYGAGIGGGHFGAGSGITISGGEVTANSEDWGAGIGGGFQGAGEDITINDGKVTATGGYLAAGIGGGSGNTGKNITINDGEVIATGGVGGAGIGGGHQGVGESIIIRGGEVTANSECDGAGIGGGGSAGSGTIEISGGAVIATSGELGAGIGSGCYSFQDEVSVGEIKISGSAQVKVAGSNGNGDNYGKGAAIGYGGECLTGGIPEDGAPYEGQDWESKLDCGSIKYYANSTSAEEMRDDTVQPIKTVDNLNIGHDYETDWTYNGTHHWHACKYDGCVEKTDVAAHTWEEYGGSAATCTKNAVTPGKKCKCGKILMEPEEVPDSATGHNWETVWSKSDTKHWHKCTNTGCTAVKDEADHNFATFVERTKEPTCTETGTDVYQCTCGATMEVIVEAGHTPTAAVKENEVPAEVGVAGSYDEVVYCASCGTELSRKTVATDPLPEPAKKNGEDFSALLAKMIRQAPENGTVEADAGAAGGLKKIVFEALDERPDVTVKLKTSAGDITIPAGANLLEKTGGKGMISFEELKELLK